MKTETTTLKGAHRVYWYEYPARTGPYGSGGWSRHAKHRPKPVLVCRQPQRLELHGKSVLVDGVRKLKCVIVRVGDGAVVRDDYGVDRIKQDLFTATTRMELDPIPAETATPPTPLFTSLGERKFPAD